MKSRLFLVVGLVLSLGLTSALLGALQVHQANAGPLLIPTPLAAVPGGQDWAMVTLMSANCVSGTETSSAQQIAAYTAADIEWVLDFTNLETVTCKLQWSNDNSNWADGVNVVAAASADATNIDQFHLYGRYMRAVCTPTTENVFTATIIAKVFN